MTGQAPVTDPSDKLAMLAQARYAQLEKQGIGKDENERIEYLVTEFIGKLQSGQPDLHEYLYGDRADLPNMDQPVNLDWRPQESFARGRGDVVLRSQRFDQQIQQAEQAGDFVTAEMLKAKRGVAQIGEGVTQYALNPLYAGTAEFVQVPVSVGQGLTNLLLGTKLDVNVRTDLRAAIRHVAVSTGLMQGDEMPFAERRKQEVGLERAEYADKPAARIAAGAGEMVGFAAGLAGRGGFVFQKGQELTRRVLERVASGKIPEWAIRALSTGAGFGLHGFATGAPPGSDMDRAAYAGLQSVMGTVVGATGALAQRAFVKTLGDAASKGLTEPGMRRMLEAAGKWAEKHGRAMGWVHPKTGQVVLPPAEYLSKMATEWVKAGMPGYKMPWGKVAAYAKQAGLEGIGFSVLDMQFNENLLRAVFDGDWNAALRALETLTANTLGVAFLHAGMNLKDIPRWQRATPPEAQVMPKQLPEPPKPTEAEFTVGPEPKPSGEIPANLAHKAEPEPGPPTFGQAVRERRTEARRERRLAEQLNVPGWAIRFGWRESDQPQEPKPPGPLPPQPQTMTEGGVPITKAGEQGPELPTEPIPQKPPDEEPPPEGGVTADLPPKPPDEGPAVELPRRIEIPDSPYYYDVQVGLATPSRKLREALGMPEGPMPLAEFEASLERASLLSALQSKALLPGTEVSVEGIKASGDKLTTIRFGETLEKPLAPEGKFRPTETLVTREPDEIGPVQQQVADVLEMVAQSRPDLPPEVQPLLDAATAVVKTVAAENDQSVLESLPAVQALMPVIAQAPPEQAAAAVKAVAESLTTKPPQEAIADMQAEAQKGREGFLARSKKASLQAYKKRPGKAPSKANVEAARKMLDEPEVEARMLESYERALGRRREVEVIADEGRMAVKRREESLPDYAYAPKPDYIDPRAGREYRIAKLTEKERREAGVLREGGATHAIMERSLGEARATPWLTVSYAHSARGAANLLRGLTPVSEWAVMEAMPDIPTAQSFDIESEFKTRHEAKEMRQRESDAAFSKMLDMPRYKPVAEAWNVMSEKLGKDKAFLKLAKDDAEFMSLYKPAVESTTAKDKYQAIKAFLAKLPEMEKRLREGERGGIPVEVVQEVKGAVSKAAAAVSWPLFRVGFWLGDMADRLSHGHLHAARIWYTDNWIQRARDAGAPEEAERGLIARGNQDRFAGKLSADLRDLQTRVQKVIPTFAERHIIEFGGEEGSISGAHAHADHAARELTGVEPLPEELQEIVDDYHGILGRIREMAVGLGMRRKTRDGGISPIEERKPDVFLRKSTPFLADLAIRQEGPVWDALHRWLAAANELGDADASKQVWTEHRSLHRLDAIEVHRAYRYFPDEIYADGRWNRLLVNDFFNNAAAVVSGAANRLGVVEEFGQDFPKEGGPPGEVPVPYQEYVQGVAKEKGPMAANAVADMLRALQGISNAGVRLQRMLGRHDLHAVSVGLNAVYGAWAAGKMALGGVANFFEPWATAGAALGYDRIAHGEKVFLDALWNGKLGDLMEKAAEESLYTRDPHYWGVSDQPGVARKVEAVGRNFSQATLTFFQWMQLRAELIVGQAAAKMVEDMAAGNGRESDRSFALDMGFMPETVDRMMRSEGTVEEYDTLASGARTELMGGRGERPVQKSGFTGHPIAPKALRFQGFFTKQLRRGFSILNRMDQAQNDKDFKAYERAWNDLLRFGMANILAGALAASVLQSFKTLFSDKGAGFAQWWREALQDPVRAATVSGTGAIVGGAGTALGDAAIALFGGDDEKLGRALTGLLSFAGFGKEAFEATTGFVDALTGMDTSPKDSPYRGNNLVEWTATLLRTSPLPRTAMDATNALRATGLADENVGLAVRRAYEWMRQNGMEPAGGGDPDVFQARMKRFLARWRATGEWDSSILMDIAEERAKPGDPRGLKAVADSLRSRRILDGAMRAVDDPKYKDYDPEKAKSFEAWMGPHLRTLRAYDDLLESWADTYDRRGQTPAERRRARRRR